MFTLFCNILYQTIDYICFLMFFCFMICFVNRVLTFSIYMMFQTFGTCLFYFAYVNIITLFFLLRSFGIISKSSMTLFQNQNAHEAILKQLALIRLAFCMYLSSLHVKSKNIMILLILCFSV